MKYLKATIDLKLLIKEANITLLTNSDVIKDAPNQMLIKTKNGDTTQVAMKTFSNEFVDLTLSEWESEAFIITDVASMDVQGNEMQYILYKGYHRELEKGMVFYQTVDQKTFEPIGKLEFSNMEDNIFYKVESPEAEESSCSAMETDKKLTAENSKEIVFLIGHMDEKRLAYDVERLVVDTVHNVSKNDNVSFNFIIHIARYGGKPSKKLKSDIEIVEKYIKKHFYSEYLNARFKFSYEQDGSLS